jgi:hypothetical protein
MTKEKMMQEARPKERIIQVSGIGCNPIHDGINVNYFLVGLTNMGRVIMSSGDGEWGDVSDPATKERLKDIGYE